MFEEFSLYLDIKLDGRYVALLLFLFVLSFFFSELFFLFLLFLVAPILLLRMEKKRCFEELVEGLRYLSLLISYHVPLDRAIKMVFSSFSSKFLTKISKEMEKKYIPDVLSKYFQYLDDNSRPIFSFLSSLYTKGGDPNSVMNFWQELETRRKLSEKTSTSSYSIFITILSSIIIMLPIFSVLMNLFGMSVDTFEISVFFSILSITLLLRVGRKAFFFSLLSFAVLYYSYFTENKILTFLSFLPFVPLILQQKKEKDTEKDFLSFLFSITSSKITSYHQLVDLGKRHSQVLSSFFSCVDERIKKNVSFLEAMKFCSKGKEKIFLTFTSFLESVKPLQLSLNERIQFFLDTILHERRKENEKKENIMNAMLSLVAVIFLLPLVLSSFSSISELMNTNISPSILFFYSVFSSFAICSFLVAVMKDFNFFLLYLLSIPISLLFL